MRQGGLTAHQRQQHSRAVQLSLKQQGENCVSVCDQTKVWGENSREDRNTFNSKPICLWLVRPWHVKCNCLLLFGWVFIYNQSEDWFTCNSGQLHHSASSILSGAAYRLLTRNWPILWSGYSYFWGHRCLTLGYTFFETSSSLFIWPIFPHTSKTMGLYYYLANV